MSGERFGSFGEGSQASPEGVKSPEVVKERGDMILKIIEKMDSTLSVAKRKYTGDSKKSLQHATKDDATISADLTQYEQARQEALSLGMSQEADKIENKMDEIRDAWVTSRMQSLGGQSGVGEPTPEAGASGASSASESNGSANSEPEAPAEEVEKPAELAQPDYEELLERNEYKNWESSNEELEMILKGGTPEQKLRTPEQAIKELRSDIETIKQEIKALQELHYFDNDSKARRNKMVEEAHLDMLSLEHKIFLIEQNMKQIRSEILPDVSTDAAGGEIDDLAPGRSADDEARARRVLDWSHAKYLYDARNGEDGSDAALKAMYLKERSELMQGRMTREQADEAIIQNRGLTKEDLEKLNYDIEDESDEEAYIKAGEEALAAAQKMAEEMHKNQAEGKPIVLDAEFAKKLGELRDQLREAKAKRDDLLAIDPKTGHPYKTEDSAEVKEIDALIQDLFNQIQEMEEKRITENAVAESVMLNEADPAAVKKSLWEKLKERNGLKRAFRKIGTKVAALVLTALAFVGTADKTVAADDNNNQTQPTSGIEMQTGVASVIEGVADGIVQQAAQMAEQATIDAKNIKDVNLTQMQLEGIFGEAGAREIMNLNDQEYMDEMGYQRLDNGVFYDDDEYQGYGDLGNKVSKYAFAMDHTDVWEKGDEEEIANLTYRMAHGDPIVLSAYLVNYPDILEYMGLPRDIKATDLGQMMTNGEEGAELQRKGLQAFEALLESKRVTIECGTISGLVRTDYISSPSNVSPADRELKYNKAVRDNAKVFFINYHTTNPDGSERVDSMVITATCMQNNVFLQSPIKSPSGEPVVVVTDVEIIDEDTDEDVTDTDEDITDTDEDIDETTDEDVDEDTDTDTDTDTDEDITDTDDSTDDSKEDEPNDDSPKEDQPNKEDPKDDPTHPSAPVETVKVKDPNNMINNDATQKVDGTVSQRSDFIDVAGRTDEVTSIPPKQNHKDTLDTMLEDPSVSDAEKQQNHANQATADQKADEKLEEGPLQDVDYENLMDWYTQQSETNTHSNRQNTTSQGAASAGVVEGATTEQSVVQESATDTSTETGPSGTITQSVLESQPKTTDPNATQGATETKQQDYTPDYENLMDYYNQIVSENGNNGEKSA